MLNSLNCQAWASDDPANKGYRDPAIQLSRGCLDRHYVNEGPLSGSNEAAVIGRNVGGSSHGVLPGQNGDSRPIPAPQPPMSDPQVQTVRYSGSCRPRSCHSSPAHEPPLLPEPAVRPRKNGQSAARHFQSFSGWRETPGSRRSYSCLGSSATRPQ